MERLFLVDAYALIYRSYYAFMGRPMRNRQGINTSAVFGFTKFLKDIMAREKPRYLGVAFDPKGGTFRNRLYEAYKANRTETPEDIIIAIPYIKRILEAMRIPVLELPDYEADDVIGTLSMKAADKGFDVYMVTPDKDFGQLVRSNVSIYKQRKNGEGIEIVGLQQIKEHYGFDDPRLVIDMLALWGDAADNIPGIPGIGEKSAVKLICEFGTVEQIIDNIDRIKGKQRENILANRDQLFLSKRLATIATDAPIEFEPSALRMEAPDCDALREVYRELDFNMFIRQMDIKYEPSSATIPEEQDRTTSVPQQTEYIQRDLFGMAVVSDKTQTTAKPSTTAGEPAGLEKPAEHQNESHRTIRDVAHNYRVVGSDEELDALITMLTHSDRFCFDTETTGFDCFNDRIVGISFSMKAAEAFYLPLSPANGADKLARLKPLFENERIEKIGQNIKFDIMMLRSAGIEVRGFKYDTMILHYLIDPESRHGMNYLSQLYLDYQPIEIESLIGKGNKQLTMDRVPLEQIAEYGAEDADVTYRLWEILWPELGRIGLTKLYREIEEPLIDTLAEIERTGVKIDSAQLAAYGKELGIRMKELEEEICRQTGIPDLNVNSSKQLGVALFETLKITDKPKRTKTKQYSTDEEYLQTLAGKHPVIGLILDYRGIKKLLSTYIEALPQLVNKRTGRIHTSFNQAVTATGRLSSANPNLQNIPVREELGRQIRKAFIPSDEEHLLLSADYSQVELRLMAHLSGDKALIEAFEHGADIHAATAARLFGIPLAEVTPEQRRKAKTANFGIIYGISAFGLRQRINNISLDEARAIIDGYFKSYPGVKEYMERVIADARDKGYVETIFGRRRYLTDIRSANANARSLAERNAINAPIQGSAADIIKIAMNSVHRRFTERGLRSKIILQVHDELVVDMFRTEQEEVTEIVTRSMENAAQLRVKLIVDCGIGKNWLEAH